MNFKKWLEIFDPNPPAMIRSIEKLSVKQKILSTVVAVKKALLDLLDFGLNESYSYRKEMYERKIFRDCGDLCKLVQKYVPEYNGKQIRERICGTEGCAYFVNDHIVVKITEGQFEAIIATKLIGNNDIVPVLDVKKDSNLPIYYIVMEKLDTSFTKEFKEEIEKAFSLIIRHFDGATKSENFSEYLTLDKFIEYANKPVSKLAERFFYIVTEIYDRSGFLLSNDIIPSNVGMDKDNNLKLLDLGHPMTPSGKEASRTIPRVSSPSYASPLSSSRRNTVWRNWLN